MNRGLADQLAKVFNLFFAYLAVYLLLAFSGCRVFDKRDSTSDDPVVNRQTNSDDVQVSLQNGLWPKPLVSETDVAASKDDFSDEQTLKTLLNQESTFYFGAGKVSTSNLGFWTSLAASNENRLINRLIKRLIA